MIFFFSFFFDEGHKSEHSHATSEKKEGDFFHEHSQPSTKTGWDDNVAISSHSSDQSLDKTEQQTEGSSIDPNAFNNNGSKDFDVQKVTANFKEIERNIQEQVKFRGEAEK
ncbi:unnamed protein product [Rotaria sp. Silwood1]|nr:unnamed protein product [Rotaria sp. Silwood1]CAF1652269.1 unnamed protein product [Rotaria sp. Silwood1]CAF3868001.1 unnamed protein product [Rotaria sp. Silwood1]CAF4888142.1 unnamed protein product [Rotaria sp. Silwood1]